MCLSSQSRVIDGRHTFHLALQRSIRGNTKLRRKCGLAPRRDMSRLPLIDRLHSRISRVCLADLDERNLRCRQRWNGQTDVEQKGRTRARIDRSIDRSTDSLISADVANAFCESPNCRLLRPLSPKCKMVVLVVWSGSGADNRFFASSPSFLSFNVPICHSLRDAVSLLKGPHQLSPPLPARLPLSSPVAPSSSSTEHESGAREGAYSPSLSLSLCRFLARQRNWKPNRVVFSLSATTSTWSTAIVCNITRR